MYFSYKQRYSTWTLGIRLRHAYLKFHRCAQLALSDSEITADQFVLLNFLLGNTSVMQKDIVELIGSDSSTIGAVMKSDLKLSSRRSPFFFTVT